MNFFNFLQSLFTNPPNGFWSDFWAAGTTVGTLALALSTFGAIRQTSNENKISERHHRESFKPICVWEHPSGIPQVSEVIAPYDNFQFSFELIGFLRNVGCGTAFNIRAKFVILNENGSNLFHEFSIKNLRPIMVGQRLSPYDQDHYDTENFSPSDEAPQGQRKFVTRTKAFYGFTSADLRRFLDSEIFLEIYYADIFGQSFKTIYPCFPANFEIYGSGNSTDTEYREVYYVSISVGISAPNSIGAAA